MARSKILEKIAYVLGNALGDVLTQCMRCNLSTGGTLLTLQPIEQPWEHYHGFFHGPEHIS